jgi:hypothetical protein
VLPSGEHLHVIGGDDLKLAICRLDSKAERR